MDKSIIISFFFITIMILAILPNSQSNIDIINDKDKIFLLSKNNINIEKSDKQTLNFGYKPTFDNKVTIKEKSTVSKIIDYPSSWNWKNLDGYDFTTSIKDQESCGACWAFAAMGALESVVNIKEQKFFDKDFSEQYLISCCNEGSCNGCEGGWAYDAYIWLDKEDRIADEKDYPYTGSDDPCKSGSWPEYIIENPFIDASPSSIDTIKLALMRKGPLVVAMYASDNFYYNYDKGVYRNINEANYKLKKDDLNHEVVVIGFKDTPDNILYDGYWICKNSWGTDWGENGYFKLAYGYCLIDNSEIISPNYNPINAPETKIEVNTNKIHFNKGEKTKTFIIKNTGDYDSKLIWWINPSSELLNNIKSISPEKGVIKGGQQVSVTLTIDWERGISGNLRVQEYGGSFNSDKIISVTTPVCKNINIQNKLIQSLFSRYPFLDFLTNLL